ncbi:hypothetical protein CC85DRAFT_285184 [Cutaneotrichosporon oleaginosum]|uniref:Stealth protein CR3 conserved region 3 domain-containing protein n=1 Tax=Cutaneotrichosporon oleaginosum TaxID=879819 RepID=A0A0J0XNW5_9TREE|nr:uncharacterized protein CC85DRAFT_285184 [Cutaneotrichosporon oleaginosum]KLT42836.1 hypothetical protein CC85DRAFT_285184 [Cutaneotrichosporon oleaginosum]TXT08198.1 hypothetical protein COLE_05122 [Cutaneotrichosporon oleaginosum]
MPDTVANSDSAACYATAVDASPSRTVQRARGDSHLPRTRRPSPETGGLARFMANRLRALTRLRVLGVGAVWTIAAWLICRLLGSAKSPGLLSSDFPSASQRPGDALDSRDPRYRALVTLPPSPAPFPLLRPTRSLPIHCLESWFLDGTTSCGKHDAGPEVKLDATWTWVNGSDGRWRSEMEYWRGEAGIYSPDQHFRDYNELVYSMRSVLKALQGHLRTFHLVVYDYAFDVTHDTARLTPTVLSPRDTLRVAQTPTWLDFSQLNASAKGPNIQYAVHSEIFHLPTVAQDAVKVEVVDEAEWRSKSLPSYNSKSIESRLGWLPGLAETSIALNDDFFVLRPHSVADFHSPLYGDVFRFDDSFYQQPRPVLDKKLFNDAGETGGLVHANYFLSKRYPRRRRPYILHGPRVMSRNMHHEASIMFKDALTGSSSRRFRELKDGPPDIQIMFLMTALKVERWREALLWTYVVANLGGVEGLWGNSARQEIREFFDIHEDEDDIEGIEVERGERWTTNRMRIDKTFDQMGWHSPMRVKYLFSSLDGHMPPIVEPGREPSSNDKCNLDLNKCFGSFWSEKTDIPAADMFKRLTFEEPQCGDCLIMALVSSSGPLGLSSFFPPADAIYVRPRGKAPPHLAPPHLPLTPTWEEADFSLASVMSTTSMPREKVNLRHYTMRLLSRYIYVSGKTDAQFFELKNPKQANETLREVDRRPNTAMLGLNDNVEDGVGEVKALLGEWLEKRWPQPAPWERTFRG